MNRTNWLAAGIGLAAAIACGVVADQAVNGGYRRAVAAFDTATESGSVRSGFAGPIPDLPVVLFTVEAYRRYTDAERLLILKGAHMRLWPDRPLESVMVKVGGYDGYVGVYRLKDGRVVWNSV